MLGPAPRQTFWTWAPTTLPQVGDTPPAPLPGRPSAKRRHTAGSRGQHTPPGQTGPGRQPAPGPSSLRGLAAEALNERTRLDSSPLSRLPRSRHPSAADGGGCRTHPHPPFAASRIAAPKGAKWPPESLNSAGGGGLARGARADGREGRQVRRRRHVGGGGPGRAVPGAGPRRGRAVPPRSPDGGAGTCGQALAAAGGRPPAVLSGSGSAARLPAVFPLQPLPFRAPLPRFPAGCETPRSRSLQRSASRCCCPASASLCRPVSPQLAVPA